MIMTELIMYIQYILEGEYYSYMDKKFKKFYDFYDTVGVSKELIKGEFSLDEVKAFKIEMMCPNDEIADLCLKIVQRNEEYDYVNSIALKSFELLLLMVVIILSLLYPNLQKTLLLL